MIYPNQLVFLREHSELYQLLKVQEANFASELYHNKKQQQNAKEVRKLRTWCFIKASVSKLEFAITKHHSKKIPYNFYLILLKSPS